MNLRVLMTMMVAVCAAGGVLHVLRGLWHLLHHGPGHDRDGGTHARKSPRRSLMHAASLAPSLPWLMLRLEQGTPLNQAGVPGSSGSSTPGHSPTRTAGGAAAPQAPSSSSPASPGTSGGAASSYRPPTSAARSKSPPPASSTGISPSDVAVAVEQQPASRAPAPAPSSSTADSHEID